MNFRYKLAKFMSGRYGNDNFSKFLSIAALVIIVISMFFRSIPAVNAALYYLALAALVFSLYRSLSRNIFQRRKENNKYLFIKNKVTKKFKLIKNILHDRKTHRYYKCPSCKEFVRITNPGKGRTITITCSNCRHRFDKKT